MLCFGLFVMFCEPQKPAAVDSFCQSYQRVIRQPSESAITASLNVKQRLAANEITYRCVCEKWDNPLCRAKNK
jgi:predicted glycosyltransferase